MSVGKDDQGNAKLQVSLVQNLSKAYDALKTKYLESSEAAQTAGFSFSGLVKWLLADKDAAAAAAAKHVVLNAAALAGNVVISMLVSYGISKAISAWQEYSNRVENAAEATSEAADAAKQTTQSLQDLVDAYEDLGEESGWDTDDFEQAKELNEEIYELLKNQAGISQEKLNKLDLENGKYEEQLAILKDITLEQLRQEGSELKSDVVAQKELLKKTAKKDAKKVYSPLFKGNENEEKIKSKIYEKIDGSFYDESSGVISLGVVDFNDPDSILEWYDKINDAILICTENMTEEELAESGLYQWLVNNKNALQDQVSVVKSSTAAWEDNAKAQAKIRTRNDLSGDSNTAKGLKNQIAVLKNELGDIDSVSLSSLLNGEGLEGLSEQALSAIQNILNFMTGEGFTDTADGIEGFIDTIEDLGFVAPKAASAMTPLEDFLGQNIKSIDDATDAISDLISAYDTLNDAVNEYNSNGVLSLNTLNELLELDPKYYSCLTDENGQLKLNTETIQKMTKAKLADAKATQLKLALDAMGAIKDKETAEEYLSKATIDSSNAEALFASKMDSILADFEGDEDSYNAIAEALNLIAQNYRTIAKLIDETGSTTIENQFSQSKTSSSSGIDAWSTLSEAMEEYNKNGSICLSTMKSLMGLDAKYTSLLKKQGNELVVDAEAYRKLIQKELAHAAATDDGKDKVAQYNQILKYLDENAKNGVISLNQLENAINGTSAAIEKALTKTDDYQSALQTLHELKTLNNANSGGTEGLFNTDGLLDYDTVKKVTELINNYPDISGILIDESGNLKVDQDSLNKAMRKVVQGMINAAKDSGQNGLAQLWQNQVDNIIAGNISWEDFWNGFATGMEDANAKLDEFQSNFSTLKDAVEEFNKYGKVSQDTLQELAQMDSAYSQFLTQDAETGEYKLDSKGFRDAYVEKLKGYAEQFNGTVYGDQLLAMIDAVREPTAEEYEEMAKNTIEYLVAKARYDDKVAKIESMSGLTDEEKQAMIQAAADELQEVYKEAYESVQETGEQVTEKLVDHFDELGKTAENFKTTLSNIKSLLESFLNIFEKINSNKSNDLSLWGDAVQDELDDRIEALEKQKEALEENNDAVERAIELSRLQDELARAQSQKTVRVYTSNGYEWQSDASAVRDVQQNLSDKQREWKKEDAEKAIDDRIDKLNELKDKYSEAMEDIGSSWDDYNKKLKYAAQLQGMTFTEMEGQLDSYKDSIVANLKNDSVTTGIQDTISNISTLIETLETMNNVLTWFTSGGTSIDGGGFSGVLSTIGKLFNGTLKNEVNTGLDNLSSSVTEWVTKGSGNSIVKSISGVFDNVKTKISDIFSNKSTGIVGIVSNGLSSVGKVIGSVGKGVVSMATTVGSGIGSALGVGGLAAGGAAATAIGSIPVVGALAGAVGLGVNSTVQMTKKNKEIWSDDSKSTGSKILSTIGNTLWSSSPFGIVANGVKTISGFVKKIFGIQDKDSKSDKESSGNTVTNISSNTNITNITTNGTQTTETTESTSTTSTSDTASDDGEQESQGFLSKVLNSKLWFWNWGKRASGDKGIKCRGVYNVDEQGSELLVRQPQSGRYTYLETGDGVVPADITSRLFEMGGNPDKWFSEQMAKHSAASVIQNRTSGGTSYSIGDININNPVGDADALARDIVTRLPSCVDQQINKR